MKRLLLFGMILLFVAPVFAEQCDWTGIQQGDLCPKGCDTSDYWGNPTSTKSTDCYAACTYGDGDCTIPCWNCLNPIQSPDDRQCTSPQIAASDTLFWAYHIHFGREHSGYSPGPNGGIYEAHYISNARYFSRKTLFDESGLNGGEYRQWEEWDENKYHFMVKDLKTGVPFAYGIHLLDADSGPHHPGHQRTACSDFIKATFSYDPTKLEILGLDSTMGVELCAIKQPGEIECYLNRMAGMHRGMQGAIVARPLQAFSGNPYPFTVSAYFPQEGFTLTDSDMSSVFPDVSVTGSAKQRSVAQLATSSYELMADMEDALWQVIVDKHDAAPSLPGMNQGQSHTLVYDSQGVPDDFSPLTGPWFPFQQFRLTREGIVFGQLSNKQVTQSNAPMFRTLSSRYQTSAGEAMVYLMGVEVEGTTLSGWMRLRKPGGFDTNYFRFTKQLPQNHFDTGPSASLSCAPDGKTVKVTVGGSTSTLAVCDNTCNAAGQCLLDSGAPYTIYAGTTGGGAATTLLTPECSPGQGRSCSGPIRELCLDHYWSGCPAGVCVQGESRPCDCSPDWMGSGTQYCNNNEWGACTNCNPCSYSSECTVGHYKCWSSCHGDPNNRELWRCVDNGCGRGYWSAGHGCAPNADCAALGSEGGPYSPS